MVSPLVTEFITHSADNSFYLQTKDVVVLRMCIIYRIVGAGPGGAAVILSLPRRAAALVRRSAGTEAIAKIIAG